MTRVDQRQVLKAFSRDYTRELHNLLATDLGRYPQFVFQQLYNRLQWHVAEGEAAERITGEAARRRAAGLPPWLHLRTRQKESEALIRALAGHGHVVTACAFSPDGQSIVSGSLLNTTLKLWDAETGTCRATLERHGGAVRACAFSPDGRRIASGSFDRTLRLWDAATGACEATLEGHRNAVMACAFSPDGRRLVSASWDRTLKLWDAGTCVCEVTLEGHSDEVNACAFSPDGRRIVSASHAKTLKLWAAGTGACEATLEGHDGGA